MHLPFLCVLCYNYFAQGLHKLNLDGTPVLGTDGVPVPAYDNDDITTLAGLWTGFAIAGEWRSNTEHMVLGGSVKVLPFTRMPYSTHTAQVKTAAEIPHECSACLFAE
jgi:hypothetical protein